MHSASRPVCDSCHVGWTISEERAPGPAAGGGGQSRIRRRITSTSTRGSISARRRVAKSVGPKIRGMHYKNKTGYKRRFGHRQPLTVLKITGVSK